VENPETERLNTELDRQRLGLTDIIRCEMLLGVRYALSFAKTLTARPSCG
jgi:hypothetical protein